MAVPWNTRGPLPEQVDAIVIGAGLGGLMCAVELASRGRRVCVLEAHSQPGGYAHTFRRKGFLFDVSLHHLGGLLRANDPTRRHLEAVGVFDKLDVRARQSLLTVHFPDETINIPSSSPLESLCRRFPDEAAGLRKLFVHLSSLRDALTSETNDPATLQLKGQYRQQSWADLVRLQQLSDPKLLAVLGQLWMYIGLPPAKAAANYWTKVFGSFFVDRSAHIPRAGLTAAFCARLKELGSSVHTNKPVTRIVTTQGKATGIELDGGQRVQAALVISNANPFQTFLELLPPESTSTAFRFRLQRMQPSLSAYVTFCGLNCPPSQLGIPRGNSMVFHGTDLESAYDQVVEHDIDHSDWAMTSYEGVDDDPAGSKISFFELTPARNWLDLSPEDYRREKKQVEDQLFKKYARRYPGLEEHLVVREFGTPRTMKRYTRNHQGAIYGFAQSPDQANTLRLGARTPIPGLLLTGAWVRPGGGYEGAMLSGMETARVALGDAWQEARISSFRPHSPPLESTTAPPKIHRGQVRVHYQDTDATGSVYHATYFRYFGEIRRLALLAWGIDPDIEFCIEAVDVRYMNAAGLGATLDVEIAVDAATNDRLVLRERILSGKTLLVESATEISRVQRDDGAPPAGPINLEGMITPRRRPPLQPPPIDVQSGGEPHFGSYACCVEEHDLNRHAQLTFEGVLRLLERARYECLELAMEELFDELVAGSRARVYRMVVQRRGNVPFLAQLRLPMGAQVVSKHRVAVHQEMIDRGSGQALWQACIEILNVDAQGALATIPDGLEDKFRAARVRFQRPAITQSQI